MDSFSPSRVAAHNPTSDVRKFGSIISLAPICYKLLMR